MPSSLNKLQKFVSLEIKRNYDNKAVVGGLDKILENWLIEAQREKINEYTIQQITPLINRYKDEDITGRANTIQVILDIINTLPDAEQKPVVEKKHSSRSGNSGSRTVEPDSPESEFLSYSRALQSPVTNIHGVGASMAQKLAKLGINTISDMVHYYPRRYDDFSNLLPINRLEYGQEATVIGTVKSIATRPTRNPRVTLTEAVLTDGTGYIRLSWFNQPFLANVITTDMQIVVSGKVEKYLGRLTINSPEWEKLEKEQLHTNRIVPVYSLAADLKQRTLRNLMYRTISYWSARLEDYIPGSIVESAGLLDLPSAVQQIHFPDSIESLKKARHRIAFNEIFLLQMGALQQKKRWQNNTARTFQVSEEWLETKAEKIPFALTAAQKRSIADVRQDLASGIPMNRLIQGDVGAGKTLVAATACAIILENQAQAAILAPTSILAEQHYKTFQSILSKSVESPMFDMLDPGAIRLLVGGTPDNERAEILEGLKNGQVRCIIGTHALLEEPVQFADLQLAVIDEQHRFGVKQRAILRAKGENLHLLLMTATPIPRSLALTIYGDLDLSVIDEIPPGRQTIDTFILRPIEKERAYSLILSQIQAGHQVFIIYPFVENENDDDSKSAVKEFVRLKSEVFPGVKVGLVHGKMKPDEKDQAMSAFRDKEVDILVATSVIEVGLDIPNATVMMIEGANRFGLAQLHQLRGRVGRGASKSYCLLIPESDDAVENERLVAMSSTGDGFLLAEQDLAQRGPGEFFGIRQSGYSNLKIASLSNIKLIEQSRHYAQQLFESDPNLEDPQHQTIKALMQYHWEEGQGDIS